MKSFLKSLDENFERYIAAALMLWIAGWTFFQVISRFWLKDIYWAGTEEMARYSFIWMVMLGTRRRCVVRFPASLCVEDLLCLLHGGPEIP